MHKVIVERPRIGGTKDRQQRAANVALEDLPVHESIRPRHGERKTLTDNLRPLRRWLHAQVGRPWDAVYSEACAVIKPNSTVRNHLKIHLLEMVERNTFLRGREVWCSRTGWGWGGGSEIPVSDLAGRWQSFYVHPRSGLLCEVRPPRRRDWWRETRAEKLEDTCRWIREETVLVKLHGCWFECAVRPLADDAEAKANDRAFGQVLDRSTASAIYGKAVYCVSKRQLSRADLDRYGLSNAAAEVS
jgi:hypothetical protein